MSKMFDGLGLDARPFTNQCFEFVLLLLDLLIPQR